MMKTLIFASDLLWLFCAFHSSLLCRFTSSGFPICHSHQTSSPVQMPEISHWQFAGPCKAVTVVSRRGNTGLFVAHNSASAWPVPSQTSQPVGGWWWHVTASGVRPLLTLTWPRRFTSTPPLPLLPNTAHFGPKQSKRSVPKLSLKDTIFWHVVLHCLEGVMVEFTI